MITKTHRLQYRPVRSDGKNGAQKVVKPYAIVVHTAEGRPFATVTWLKNLIETRKDAAGSYHSGVYQSGWEQFRDYSHEAFHTAPFKRTKTFRRMRSNARTIGLAFTNSTHHWKTYTEAELHQILAQGAKAAGHMIAWSDTKNGILIPPKRISAAEFWSGEPGFIAHSDLDPTRRHDPGKDFPWDAFLDMIALPKPPDPTKKPIVRPKQQDENRRIQARINRVYPDANLVEDGVIGPITSAWIDRGLTEAEYMNRAKQHVTNIMATQDWQDLGIILTTDTR